MQTHETSSPLAGKTVKIREDAQHPQVPNFGGSEIWIEDWWDKLTGGSWMDAEGNPAALIYAMRTGFSNYKVPTDNEVLYGKIGGLGHLIHVCEIDEEE